MNMHDNELDELFRVKLGGLEVEPDAHVWNNIAAKLGSDKKRRLVPMLRIAASVVVVLAAGTWFALRQNTGLQNNSGKNRVAHTKSIKHDVNTATNVVSATQLQETNASSKVDPVSRIAASIKRHPAKKAAFSVKSVLSSVSMPESTDFQTEQTLTAVIEPTQTKPVLPDVQLSIKPAEVETATIKPVNTLASSAPLAANQSNKKNKKHGIHSFGDLINVVVAKVDKREDKFIEFTNTDDDEATITAVNLGIIKVKKEK